MKKTLALLNNLIRSQSGMTLVEVLIALAIMGFTVVFVGGLYTTFKSIPVDRDSIYIESIARSQMEDTMNADYVDNAASYPAMTDAPEGFYVTAPAAEIIDPNNIGTTPASDLGIQRITVSVYKGTNPTGDLVFTLVGYKIKPW